MEKKYRREFHFFVLTDYEQEEEFLRRMHQGGHRLVKVTLPGFYYFENCEPEDVVYRLDFNPQKVEDRVSYLQMYQDYGWEYLQDLNGYSYFRKSAEQVSPEDTEIFSDSESRLDMLRRIFRKRMLVVLCIFLCCVIPNIMRVFSGEGTRLWGLGMSVFWVVMFALYVFILVRCGIGFYQLRRKYSREE